MKKFVTHDGKPGIIERVNDGVALVRFPSAFPFPTLKQVPVKQLKQRQQKKNLDSYGTATF